VSEELEYEDIEAATDIRSTLVIEPVVCPEWPGPSGKPGRYGVAELMGDDYDEYQSGMFDVEGNDYTLNMRRNSIRLLAKCLVNLKTGQKLYPVYAEGIAEVGKKGQGGIARLSAVARRLNGLDSSSKKVLEGKSEATPSACSTSDSPESVDTPAGEPSSVT
jgi:hypothetical protein